VKKTTFDRRRLLRGVVSGTAVAVALPRLEVMLDGNGEAWAAGGPLPRRFGVWAIANGVHLQRWVPATTGPGYELQPQLAPLAPVKEHFTVLTGTNIPPLGANPARGHAAAHTILMTGVGMTGGDQTYTAAGKSIDQMIAEGLPPAPRKSIEVGVATGPGQEPGTAFHWWSHNGPNSPNICSYSCQEVFERLFTGVRREAPASGVVDVTARTRTSILDFVKAEADDLMRTLGRPDQIRMQQHLEGIAAIERRLHASAAVAASGPLRRRRWSAARRITTPASS
jgi:hypothetical protein